MKIENLCMKYFELFSNQDIEGLSELLADDICLIDWEINEIGINNVITANKNIFNSVDSIYVEPKIICVKENIAMCKIDIIINKNLENEEHLKVIDILSFNDKNLISRISAYKQ